jgi:hypothetical protein
MSLTPLAAFNADHELMTVQDLDTYDATGITMYLRVKRPDQEQAAQAAALREWE